MKTERFLELMNDLPEELLQKGETPRRKRSFPLLAAAACITLLAGVCLFPLFTASPTDVPHGESFGESSLDESSGDVSYEPIVIPVVPLEPSSPQALSGQSLHFIQGSSANGSGGAAAPPRFEFSVYAQCVVKAKLTEVLEDLYQPLEVSPSYRPTQYRLLKFETLEVYRGEDVPSEFYYRIPAYLQGEFTKYDCFFLSMSQVGLAGYTTVNLTENAVEQLRLPLFEDYMGKPQLGGIIAFTDGVFDESLWQDESWIYGYQFGDHMLDVEDPYLVVHRGYREEDTAAAIREQIADLSYPPEKVLYLSGLPEGEAKALAEELLSMENGIYAHWTTVSSAVFTRFIDGCQTEERIVIDFATGEITPSEVSYTPSDLESLPNIALYAEMLAKSYRERLPTPPLVDPAGKELLSLSVYAWYAKAGDQVYGVCKTTWVYYQDGEGYAAYNYFDEAYLLCTPEENRTVTREELIELLGIRNLLRYPLGEAYEIPLC